MLWIAFASGVEPHRWVNADSAKLGHLHVSPVCDFETINICKAHVSSSSQTPCTATLATKKIVESLLFSLNTGSSHTALPQS